MQLKKFSQAAQKVLLQSRIIAQKNHHQLVEPEHLAMALLTTLEIGELVKKKNIEYKELNASLLDLLHKLPVSNSPEPSFSARLIQALSFADALSISKGHEHIVVSDMFLGLLENKDKFGALGGILAQHFLSVEAKGKKTKSSLPAIEKNETLTSVTENINNLIKNNQIDPVFGREKEIEQLVQILSRKTRNNPLLIGEPGVGRTSIVYALVKRIIEQTVASHLVSREVLALDMAALVVGTTLRGQFEERIKKMLEEVSLRQGHYILFIPDMSHLMGLGGEGASDAANLLKPSLQKGLIQLIGVVTPEGYKKRIESEPSFERFFQPLWINPPSPVECESILLGLRPKYEQFHGVFISDDAIKSSVELGARHLTGQVLPELALDVLDEACSRHRIDIDQRPPVLENLDREITMLTQRTQKKETAQLKNKIAKLKQSFVEKNQKYEEELSIISAIRAIKGELLIHNIENKEELLQELESKEKELKTLKKSDRFIDPWVKRDDIALVISQKTGIPVQKMMQSEREKLASMEEILDAQVIGQKEAVEAVSNAIRRARVGLKDPKRPIGSFLFLGPTGVGKTELARTLTNFLFDDERAMVRFDMSEFMERHSVARLIGAPPGYQGSEEGGQLTEKVRRKPYSVVLFDEIEKAHADVLNVLLQVLDEGRLTDSKGHLVQFSNTVVIMTSNVGAEILLGHGNLDRSALQNRIMDRLLDYLRPELINRIDEIVIFNPLLEEAIRGIADLALKHVIQRMSNEGYLLSIGKDVRDLLVKEGYSREFGARPLKRAIQKLLENPLALALVKGDFIKSQTIEAYVDNENKISFRRAS